MWKTILKIAIAILTAIASVLGISHVDATLRNNMQMVHYIEKQDSIIQQYETQLYKQQITINQLKNK